jgi:two-component system OmpR family response regulator
MMQEPALTPESSPAPRALLIDTDSLLRRGWEKSLRAEGFAVTGTSEPEAALILTTSFKPDVVVLDLRLRAVGPHRAGFFAEVRSMTDAYLVGLTDHSDELERVRLLRAGADDVVTKPISTIELAARLRALLRRPRRITEGLVLGPPPTVMHYGPMQIDLGRRQAQVGGLNVNLTRIEFDLLAHLCQRPRDVSTRLELLRSIWGENWVGDDHVVDVHLSNLRRKLHHHAPGVVFISTVRGVGFRLADEVLRAPEAAVEVAAETVTQAVTTAEPSVAPVPAQAHADYLPADLLPETD